MRQKSMSKNDPAGMRSSAGCACTTCATRRPARRSWRVRTCLWSASCSGIGGTEPRQVTPTLPTSTLSRRRSLSVTSLLKQCASDSSRIPVRTANYTATSHMAHTEQEESERPAADSKMKPITYISLNLTGEVGADDSLIAVRVVPNGRDGSTVFGRTLNADEKDDGNGIELTPEEQLVFKPGDIEISLDDVDNRSPQLQTGYKPIANTIWTWFQAFGWPREELFRYLFATARRLDTAHALCCATAQASRTPADEPFLKSRARWFEALGNAELACIAFNRGITMAVECPNKFGIEIETPNIIESMLSTSKAIRDAFEHIDERAMGKVRQKQDSESLSVFSQPDLVSEGVIRYKEHSLCFRKEAVGTLIVARQFVFLIAAKAAGRARMTNVPIEFFGNYIR